MTPLLQATSRTRVFAACLVLCGPAFAGGVLVPGDDLANHTLTDMVSREALDQATPKPSVRQPARSSTQAPDRVMRAAPTPTVLTCHASPSDWFDSDATPAFRLQIKPAGRFVISGEAHSGEGEYRTSDMPHGLARALGSHIARGGVIQFLESGKPVLQGAYGQIDAKRAPAKTQAPWIYLLENVQGHKIKIRCTEPESMAWWEFVRH